MPNLPEGSGAIQVAYSPTPPAGGEPVITVPPRTRWLLLAVRAQLVTSAAVANRSVNLIIYAATDNTFEPPSQILQTASLVWTYCYMAGWSLQPYTNSQNVRSLCLPSPISLPAGATIRFATDFIQPTDQWSFATAHVHEWIEPQ
jgi:hypothetical protein